MAVLFVCTGNICRSAMAEAAAIAMGIEAGSAGTWAMPGTPATPSAVEVMAEVGIDLAEHRARSLTSVLQEQWDEVFAMTPGHVAEIADAGAAGLLLHPLGAPIEDPYGLPLDVYRRVRDEILDALGVRFAD